MAEGFRFRLDALLRVRQRRMEAQQQEVARIQQRVLRAQAQQQAADRELAAYRDQIRTSRQKENIYAQELSAGRHWLNRLHKRWMESGLQIDQEEKFLREAQARLAELATQYRVVVRLRERQLEKYRTEQTRREQREMDGLATTRFRRPPADR